MNNKGFTYTLQIDAEITDLVNKTAQVKKSMESMMSAGKVPGAEKIFGNIEKTIERLQQKAAQPIDSTAAFNSLQKDVTSVGASFTRLEAIIESMGGMSLSDKMDLLPSELKSNIEKANTAFSAFNQTLKEAETKSKELTTAESSLASAKKKLAEAEGKSSEKKKLLEIQSQTVKNAKVEAQAILDKKKALEQFVKTQAAYEAAGGDKQKAGGGKKELEGMNLPADRQAAASLMPKVDLEDTKAVEQAIQDLKNEYIEKSKAVTDAENIQRKYTNQLGEANNAVTVAKSKVESLEGSVNELNEGFERDKTKNIGDAYNHLRDRLGQLGVAIENIPTEYTEQNVEQLNEAFNRLVADGVAQVNTDIELLEKNFDKASVAMDNFGDKTNAAGNEINALDTRARDTQAFASRIAQFVGLEGGIEVARNAMRNAMSTIKELDAAMTEMAVVTDLEIGDYWEQLPEHTERANALGMSIKSVYEAETLYYQQGLKTNEVVAMSTETLKMARIAGLSAEDATNKMTAALRGFNMELNETSTQRVADVYSELAAITASDVSEISSAMTKTASIASSAGMEFETTAAFLSQIIETTRESAETAGTALKTVIARFQELKKDPAEIGEVDGEVIDANKIETALRSVGVSLRDTSGQFRELDDVFLELASKWDGLDTNTQRYIATIAAGSRQQSRFIAMMSDYSRTQELVVAANSSAGASNKQFEKTMDSLEAKLTELKNAWDSFTMGIMDSDILKNGVDLLTKLLTAVNNFTNTFGKFEGAAKIGLIAIALVLGAKALNAFETHLIATTATGGRANTILGALGKTFRDLGRSAIGIPKTLNDTRKKLLDLNNTAARAKTENYTKAKYQYAAAVKEATDAESHYTMVSQLSEEGSANLARADERLIASKAGLTAAQGNLYAAMELTDDQIAEANAMTLDGVSADSAAILAKNGWTASTLAQTAAAKNKTQVELADEMATKLTGKATLQSTLAKGLNALATKLQAKADKGGVGAKVASTVATKIQTAATWALNASLIAIIAVIAAILISVALLVVGIIGLVAVFKEANKNSPAGQLKSAEEAADAAAEAADRAAEAYQNLSDGLKNLEDKYDSFKDLVRGTQEWKEAVREINTEVLNLIEKYPELAKLVEKNDGILTVNFEDEATQKILDAYADKAARASVISYAAKINKNEKKANREAEAIRSDKLPGISHGYGYATRLTVETIKSVSQALASGDIYDANGNNDLTEEFTDWLVRNGNNDAERQNAETFAKELNEATKELKDFGNELKVIGEQDQIFYASMAQEAINTIDASQFTDKELKQMDVAATSEYSKAFNEASQAKLEKAIIEEGKNSETFQKAKEEVAEDLYGEDATVNGNVITYYDENGDKQTKKLTEEEFKEKWTAIDATRNMTTAFEQLPKTISKVSSMMNKQMGKAFEAIYAGKDASARTQTDILALQKFDRDQIRTTIWDELTETEKSAYGNSFDTFYSEIEKAQSDSLKALVQTQGAFTKAGLNFADDNNMSMEAAQGYANKMRSVYTRGQGLQLILNGAIDSITQSLTEEDTNTFMSTLNALDWTNMDSIETLPDTLKALGINVPQDELDAFVKKLGYASGAIRTIDLEKLKEATLALTNIKVDIVSGEQGRSFSEEAYKALIEMSPELAKSFQLGLDGQYVYLGEAMEDLKSAIDENTIATLAENTKQLTNQKIMAETANKMKEEGFDFGKMSSDDFDDEGKQREVLQDFQDRVKSEGGQIVGIEGFGNQTDIDKLEGKELNRIFADLVVNASNLPKILEDINTNTVQAAAITYQQNSAVENAYNIGMGESYESSEQNAKNEFDARSNALMVQAQSSGVTKNIVDEYTTIIAAYKKGEKSYSEVLAVQKKLANTSDYLKMRAGLQSVFETIKGIKEEYNKIADGDATGKINKANEALAEFGIQVNNEADADKYMALIEQVSQGNTTALQEIVAAAQEQAGLAVDVYGNAYSQGWDTLTTEQIAFFDQLAAANLGYWKKLTDGTVQFVWATVNELNTIADAAGTIVTAWENPYDVLYNLNQEVNATIREREKLERAYNRALQNSSSSAQDLAKITGEQLTNLKEEASLQKEIAQAAYNKAQAKIKENSQYNQFYTYDSEAGTLKIDDNAVEAQNWSDEEGKAFEEFINFLQEQLDVARESEDKLDEIIDEVDEIEKRGRDSTSDIYNQVKDGLIKERQTEIDKLSDINDSIQEAQDNLVESIQEQIAENRQARENEETESDITDKKNRLAFLQRDSSGANALEIAELEKEIAQAEQDYTDTLVDQSIQQLQDANEKAAEQRERQIELAQLQLDAYANSAEIWSEVQRIVDASLQQMIAGVPFADTEAGQLSQLADDVEALNPFEKEDFINELNVKGKESAIYQGLIGVDGKGGTLASMAKDIKSAISALGPSIVQALTKYSGTTTTNEEAGTSSGLTKLADTTRIFNSPYRQTNDSKEETPKMEDTEDKEKSSTGGGGGSFGGFGSGGGGGGGVNSNIVATLYDPMGSFRFRYGFATGGLADFTGPAWLDGTKSRPEYVLNSAQTERFFSLVDVLERFDNKEASNPKSGDNYFDIEITVEKLENDYDVEQVADKIRRMIYEDSIYRNVNTINSVR